MNKQRRDADESSPRHWIWSWSCRKGILAFILILGIIPVINAQSSGSRGGVNSHPNAYGLQQATIPPIVPQRVEDYIIVDSKIELRVKPDQIRIVLAIGENAKTSSECEEKVFSKIEKLKASLTELGVKPDDVVDDFIAILPRYKYVIEEVEGHKVAVETLLDYSMQSNLHIKVPNDDLAMRAIRAAFKLNITDIIAFDYWSKELDAVKQKALELAIEKAKSKAQLLLGQTFDDIPAPINITSDTQLVMPESLYVSFDNSHSQTLTQGYNRGNLPVITAFRPKNTYYKGYIDRTADQQPDSVSLNCEISVVSSVKLFFASPVSERLLATRSFATEKLRNPNRNEPASSQSNKVSHRNTK